MILVKRVGKFLFSATFPNNHNLYTHNTNECQELGAVREGRIGRLLERNDQGYG